MEKPPSDFQKYFERKKSNAQEKIEDDNGSNQDNLDEPDKKGREESKRGQLLYLSRIVADKKREAYYKSVPKITARNTIMDYRLNIQGAQKYRELNNFVKDIEESAGYKKLVKKFSDEELIKHYENAEREDWEKDPRFYKTLFEEIKLRRGAQI